MSDVLTITTAHLVARNQATLALADDGPANSYLRLYAAEAPVAGDPHLANLGLDKPCGTVAVDGKIVLQQAAAAGDVVVVGGAVRYALWFSADDAVIAGGAVTDSAGEGPFRLTGTNGTDVYAGGLVFLGTTEIY